MDGGKITLVKQPEATLTGDLLDVYTPLHVLYSDLHCTNSPQTAVWGSTAWHPLVSVATAAPPGSTSSPVPCSPAPPCCTAACLWGSPAGQREGDELVCPVGQGVVIAKTNTNSLQSLVSSLRKSSHRWMPVKGINFRIKTFTSFDHPVLQQVFFPANLVPTTMPYLVLKVVKSWLGA